MPRWLRGLFLTAIGLLPLLTLVGCAQNERTKTTVINQQVEEEVVEEEPGEMIVE